MAQSLPERVLVWDRVDANRRNTALLMLAMAVIMLPAVAYVAQYLMVWVALTVGSADDFLWEMNFGLAIAVTAVIALGIIAVVAILQYRFAAVLIVRFSGAREVTKDDAPELHRVVENLCIGAGVPRPRLYVIESDAANAFATGVSRERWSFVVTRGLLGLLDRRELEGVAAHELVQIANGDTLLSTLLASGVALLRLPLTIVATVLRFLFRIHWAVGAGALLYLGLPLVAGVPLAVTLALDLMEEDPLAGVLLMLAMVLPLYVLVGAPLAGEMVRALVLQGREHLADAEALLLTRHAEGLARALVKMEAAGGPALPVATAASHLYVVDPLPDGAPLWDRPFASHPPIEERLSRLSAMAGGFSPRLLRESVEEDARRRRSATYAPAPANDAPPVRREVIGNAPPIDDEPKPVAFRLAGNGASLYGSPSTQSPPITELPGGSLITVTDTDGDFVRVITTDDRLGYIHKSAAMTEVPIDASATD